ncbi:S1C family serine protease [Cyclobacterium salsum]|uniref:S1C family serine protease n=1 Tax=Cyclobacterium salsum TaxID=2666329 RepID=UPI00139190CE|nr:S1C family serine protease [Cyclobacterium salsum]
MERFNSSFPTASPDGRAGSSQGFTSSQNPPVSGKKINNGGQRKTQKTLTYQGSGCKVKVSGNRFSGKKTVALGLLVSMFFSGCATILNSKYQKVAIEAGQGQKEVLVNGKVVKPEQGAYLLQRDRKPKQLTIRKEGYKEQHYTLMQYKRPPLYYLSWVPFALTFAPVVDTGKKAYDYDKSLETDQGPVRIPDRDAYTKNIRINNVAVNLNSEDVKYRFFPTYRNHKRRQDKKRTKTSEETDKIEVTQTVFPDLLNEVLKENGYIDTSNRAIKNTYLNDLLVDASIQDYTLNHVANYHTVDYGGMVYVDLNVRWQALDFYKTPVYSQTINTRSGQFAIHDYDRIDGVIHDAIKDALEYGLIELMNNDKMIALLNDREQEQMEEQFDELILPRPTKFVSNLNDAVKSSMTIKHENGHGSGFLISESGHIITNYHVVSNQENIQAIFEDHSIHDVEIIRVSKVHDLALLKIKDCEGMLPFQISSSKDISIAEEVYALGTPSAEDLSQTISRGIISGLRSIDGDAKLIQTDASINGGNSGGALVDKNGTVLGVVSAKLTGPGIEGVAFGIPSYEIFDRLKIQMQ